MKRLLSASLIMSFIMSNSVVLGQGISRSKGLGLQLSFWNITGRPTRINVANSAGQATVDLSGAGFGFYFFSRAYHNWFLELSMGAIGGVQSEVKGIVGTEVNVEAIVPLLFGLRYNLFATRLSSSLHPYLSIGGGPYWATSIESKNNLIGKEETVQSNFDYGYYFGGGINWGLTSWFAINFDLKYHAIKYEQGKDYSGLQFGTGTVFMWGHKREIFEIRDVKLVVSDIYPAYQQFYSTYPLALVTVKNLIGMPIEVNVQCTIQRYSEKPKNSGFIRVERGGTKDIPVTAFFGKRLNEMSKRRTAIMDLEIEARAASTYRKEFSTEITIHSRNAWNGDMDKLAFFLTPDDDQILQLSRKITEDMPAEEKSAAAVNFYMAGRIFAELSDRRIVYHPDPNVPFYQDDRVQYASETLDIETGDCDDLTVLYASLLESVGIKTAFVEVRDPQKELAHLYLLFNSGLTALEGYLISSNEKRYILRENSAGQFVIWLPVETTLMEKGFEEAWEAGALEYLQEGVLRDGLAEGWVKIIDN